jgi:hypothetical protein
MTIITIFGDNPKVLYSIFFFGSLLFAGGAYHNFAEQDFSTAIACALVFLVMNTFGYIAIYKTIYRLIQKSRRKREG